MLTLDQWDAQRQSIGTSDALHDLSVRTAARIKGEVLTRLVQLALRWIFSAEPLDRRFGPPPEKVRQRILGAGSESLLRWPDRILSAESPEAVLH